MIGDDNAPSTLTAWVQRGIVTIIGGLSGAVIYLHKQAKTQLAERCKSLENKVEQLDEENKRLVVENAMLKARLGDESAE